MLAWLRMTLSEIIETLLIDSGNFILADPDDLTPLRLNKRKLWRLVLNELRRYQDYRPFTRAFNLDIDQSHVFVAEAASIGIPEWISKCSPVGSNTNFPITGIGSLEGDQHLGLRRSQALTYQSPLPWHLRSIVPGSIPWRYEKPHLYMPYTGKIDVLGCYGYDFTETRDDNDNLIEVTIPDFELKAGTFRDMIEGKFLMAVGRSRRAFTYTPLPIETDAQSLADEGKELYESAREALSERPDWWLSVRA